MPADGLRLIVFSRRCCGKATVHRRHRLLGVSVGKDTSVNDHRVKTRRKSFLLWFFPHSLANGHAFRTATSSLFATYREEATTLSLFFCRFSTIASQMDMRFAQQRHHFFQRRKNTVITFFNVERLMAFSEGSIVCRNDV